MDNVFLKGRITGELKQLAYDPKPEPKPDNVTDSLRKTEAQLVSEIEQLQKQITSKRRACYAIRLALRERI